MVASVHWGSSRLWAYHGHLCYHMRARGIPVFSRLEVHNAAGLTRRCSRRLAGLFPPFIMINIPQEPASRALASRG